MTQKYIQDFSIIAGVEQFVGHHFEGILTTQENKFFDSLLYCVRFGVSLFSSYSNRGKT